ncbi:hypothetical protein NE236_29135 [Actinoallomurus purpureus]|uniref:hypothetical protein n=1 Tax=Actinoallomurus purpureus TaxID=478114 RepID=UPI002092B78F|nr:hypothetical protein [Actinoallomurus purpureus]MCO6009045.1 hypothetical protein [Actinoallomurus purpureus]
MPPWWLVVAWIVIVPMAVVMLVDPRRLWSRPARAWARDHPDDRYTRWWEAAAAWRGLAALAVVALLTISWVDHAHATAEPRLHGTTESEKVRAQPGSGHPVAMAPDAYSAHGTRLRVIWRSWAERIGCVLDHVSVAENPALVTVTVYEGGSSKNCADGGQAWGGFGPFTTRYTDVTLHSPLHGRHVANAEGVPVPRYK